jgi:hypothetical protein
MAVMTVTVHGTATKKALFLIFLLVGNKFLNDI